MIVALWFGYTLAPAIVFSLIAFRLMKEKFRIIFYISIALTSIAASIGILGGLSRSGAVGPIISGIIGILGASSVFLSIKNHRFMRYSIYFCVLFPFSLCTAYMGSAQLRGNTERYVYMRDLCFDTYLKSAKSDDTTFVTIRDNVLGRTCASVFHTENSKILGASFWSQLVDSLRIP